MNDFMFIKEPEVTVARERYYDRAMLFPEIIDKVEKLDEPIVLRTIAGFEVPLFSAEIEFLKRLINNSLFEGIRYTMCQDADQDLVIQLMHLKQTEEVQVNMFYEIEGSIVDSKILRVPMISGISASELTKTVLAEF